MLNLQLSKMDKPHDAAALGFDGWLREVRALDTRVRMLCDERDLLKRRNSANCNLEVTTRKVNYAQGDITNLFTVLHGSFVSSYNFIHRSIDGA